MKFIPLSLFILLLLSTNLLPQNGLGYIEEPLKLRYSAAPDSLAQARGIYNNILNNCRQIVAEEGTDYKKHKALFKFFHKNLLRKYDLEADIPSLLFYKKFDCLTAVALYAAICEDLNLTCTINKTDTHVYIKFPYDDENKIIELTDPKDGFDYLRDPEEYLEYLIEYKLITQEDLDKKGVDGIYYDYINSSTDAGKNQITAWLLYEMSMSAYFKENYALSYACINEALTFSQEKDIVDGFAYSLDAYGAALTTKRQDIDTLLFRALRLPVENRTLEETIYNRTADYFQNLYMSGKFINVDSLYMSITERKWVSSELPARFEELYCQYEASGIENMFISGKSEEAFQKSKKLYPYMEKNYAAKNIATKACLFYCAILAQQNKKDKLAELLDSAIVYFNDNQIIREGYIEAKIDIYQRLFEEDETAAEEGMNRLYAQFPESDMAKRGQAVILHHKAMAKIRQRKYKEALKIIKSALQLFPENKFLLSDLELTNDLVKNNSN